MLDIPAVTTEIQRVVEEIAEYLPGWVIHQPENGESTNTVRVVGPDGAQLTMHNAWGETNRLVVSTTFPRGCEPDRDSCPRITISSTRPPAKIAADIQRRLIPDYLEKYQKAREREATWNAFTAHENAMLEELAGLFVGAHYSPGDALDGKRAEVRVYSQLTHLHVVITGGHQGEVDLTLQNIPFATARQICQLAASAAEVKEKA